MQTLENGSLAIRQAGVEHEGLYLCEADNGVEPSLVKQIMLVVRRQAHFLDDIQVVLPPGAGPPGLGSLSTSLQQQQQQSLATQPTTSGSIKSIKLALNSSLVRLICTPYGDAPLQLDWLKDGRLIHTHSSNGPSGQQQHHQDGSIIDHQSSSSSASSGSGGDQLQQHSSQTIGHYHVSTRWLAASSSQQQQQQKFTPQYLTSGSGGGAAAAGTNGLESELLLTNLARHDAGLYTCAARNAYGQSDTKLRLIVQEPPEAPTIVDVGHISSRFISLRWLAPFDGNSPILKYVVEFRKQAASGPQTGGHEHHQHTMAFEADLANVGRSEKLMPLQAPIASSSSSSSSSSLSHLHQQQSPSQIDGFEQLVGVQQQQQRQQQQQQHALQLTSGTGGLQVQHNVHDLEPMTRYSMRVIAINALGASRPSVALSLRTEEEGKWLNLLLFFYLR